MKNKLITLITLSIFNCSNASIMKAANKIECIAPSTRGLPTVISRFTKHDGNDVDKTTHKTWSSDTGYNKAYWDDRCNKDYREDCMRWDSHPCSAEAEF